MTLMESRYVMASFSGGKDSTAMVLRMIERGDQLDDVVFCDTGMEFPAMYDHIAKVREHVEAEGVKFTTLKPELPFREYLLDFQVHSKTYGVYNGFGWPSMKVRWCTKHLKTRMSERYRKGLRDSGDVELIVCTGLAFDEQNRIERTQNSSDRHPLAEWGWTEDIALGYCYGRGYYWYDPSVGKGLYEIFDRTSCWICPLSNLDYLRKLRRWYPDLWAEIGRLEASIRERRHAEGNDNEGAWKYTLRYSWQDLDDRFSREEMGIESRKTLEEFA